MLMIWFNKPHDFKTFTPAWAFLVRRRAYLASVHPSHCLAFSKVFPLVGVLLRLHEGRRADSRNVDARWYYRI
jgi:hypothetical protein